VSEDGQCRHTVTCGHWDYICSRPEGHERQRVDRPEFHGVIGIDPAGGQWYMEWTSPRPFSEKEKRHR
jgi:hypothetical protein